MKKEWQGIAVLLVIILETIIVAKIAGPFWLTAIAIAIIVPIISMIILDILFGIVMFDFLGTVLAVILAVGGGQEVLALFIPFLIALATGRAITIFLGILNPYLYDFPSIEGDDDDYDDYDDDDCDSGTGERICQSCRGTGYHLATYGMVTCNDRCVRCSGTGKVSRK